MHLILILDTDFNDLTTIEYFLSGLRYRVVGTSKAKKALEFARSAPPDLLIIGLSITDKESIENLAFIKKDPITKDSPVLALYKQDDPTLIEKMKKIGVVEHLVKPIIKTQLVDKVHEILEFIDAKKLKDIEERQQHIEVEQKLLGRTTFYFYSGIKKYVAKEIRSVFNKEFLESIINDIISIDLRALPEFTPEDIDILEKIILLFGSKRINLIAGRHIGVILTSSELEEKTNLFMSPEELEEFIKNKLL